MCRSNLSKMFIRVGYMLCIYRDKYACTVCTYRGKYPRIYVNKYVCTILQGVHVCIHRDKCACVYMSKYSCTMFLIKKCKRTSLKTTNSVQE